MDGQNVAKNAYTKYCREKRRTTVENQGGGKVYLRGLPPDEAERQLHRESQCTLRGTVSEKACGCCEYRAHALALHSSGS